ncbi:LOW QUALITY PROTEIN: cubilin homolog [Anopheles aquasalis]|uniref:LOW QUALITY PROTEIN: cubilin homolog n=1 Tax=Anopheles aquasalis TaxID=42839 RepID=UPI00215AFC10|nr:LOW QUALITY PROTEIN: cubilin homolog [Anopheles aquasalis]
MLVILSLKHMMTAGLEDQAKMYVSNGHIIFKPAMGKNITFSVRGAGYVNVGSHNLDQMLQTMAKWSTTGDPLSLPPSGYLGQGGMVSENAAEQLQLLITNINGPFGLLKQLDNLERASTKGNVTVLSLRIDLLARRVKSVEILLETLETSVRTDHCASGPCQNGGTCVSSYRSFQCLCPASWQGRTCAKDVNECDHLAGTGLGCQNGATCQNRPGGYSCLCADGWRGIHCNAHTQDCDLAGAELCGNGVCVQSSDGSGFRCACEPGWKTNGLSPSCTVDVDECEGPGFHCSLDPAVNCINLPGSFACGLCPVGYTGTGFYCADIDECETNNGGCSTAPSVACINTRGSFRCGACPGPYSGGGRTCVAQASRCTPDQCHPMARCVDYGTVPGCVCLPGYIGSGYGSSGCARFEAEPLNHCASAPCQNGGTCVVTNETSFSCRCPAGTEQPHCRIPSPCDSSPCQNGGYCDQLWHGERLVCRCPPGYSGLHCQTAVQECDSERYQLAGTLHYPEFNQTTLGHSTRCAWLIKTNETFTLNVTFSQFRLIGSRGECKSEWLQIHDGHSTAAPIIGRYCGTGLPNGDGHLASTSSTLYLWLYSEISFPIDSFTLHWESVESVCGGRMIVEEPGTIQWPQDDRRQSHWDCKWQLQTESGRRLQFSFVTLQLSKSEQSHCRTSFVQLTDGIDEDKGTVLAKYCGTESHPSPLTTSGSEAMLYFHDSEHEQDPGNGEVSFTIQYTVVEADCGGVYTQPVGIIASTPSPVVAQTDDDQPRDWLVCEYQISLPVGTRVEIRFVKLDVLERTGDHGSCTDNGAQLELFDGRSTADPFLGRFCGDQVPPDRLTSTANMLLVRFRRRQTKQSFRLSYAMKCGGTFTNPDLPLISPGYPSLYSGELQCEYVMHAPLGSIISFDFVDLDLGEGDTINCEWGYVELHDALSRRNLLGGGCKRSMSKRIRSTRNVLRLRYVFYGRRSAGRGFKGWFHFSEVGCGGVLTHDKDPIIHSPAIAETNQHYQRDGRCEWILEAPVGYTILLSWDSIELEPPATSGRCLQQYIEVYDNSTQAGNRQVGRYCGSQRPPTMNSAGELLTIRFVTDPTAPPKESFAFQFTFIETKQTCGGSYSGTNGVIKSPGWPYQYASNRNCVWTIDVPMGLQIRLLVRSFEVEQQDSGCRFDGLTIRNGGNDQSPLLGTFCGHLDDEDFNDTISSGHQLYLHFFSDGLGSARGFHLEWDASTTGCGGVLTAPSGMIISPNYPLAYGHNGSCSWRIIVAQGSTIRFLVTSLYLADSEPCRHDYLDVYDGTDTGGHRLGRFCGHVGPTILPQTTTNHAYLRLQSTDTYQGAGGFRLEYELVCRNNITSGRRGVLESPNFPDPYPPGLDCQWKIVVPRGNRIRLECRFFRMESRYGDATSSTASQYCPYDYLEVRQPDATSDLPVRHRYCTAPPRTFVSLGNTIELVFHSASNGSSGMERYGFQLEWSIEGCGGLLTTYQNPGVTQDFSSPGFPHSYPRNTECLWQIVTEPGQQIMLMFEELRLRPNAGCRSDGVMVANDANFLHLITTICHDGTEAPLRFVSTGHQLYVKFWSSDIDASYRGFRAKYLERTAECGGTYILPHGVINTPNYPAPYPVNTSCEWLILTELSHTLRLTIDEFVLEPSDNCTNDALQVYDGVVPAREHLLLVACGTVVGSNALPSTVSSIRHALLVTFRSNDLYSYKGFQASYVTNCGAQILVKKPGRVNLDTAHMLVATKECAWVLTAPQETERITLSFVHVSIGNVTLDVLDGDAETIGAAVRYMGHGYHIPPAIVSSGNALTVRIRSTELSLTELNDLFLEFTYTTLENACGGRLDALTGMFASPNFPLSYPAGVECVWEVSASPGNRIRLEITQLDIVPTDGCNSDYLEVRESAASGRLLGDFCGVGQPLPTNLTVAAGFWIKFRSSGPTVATGFLAQYSYESLAELDGSNGVITSPLYPRGYYAPRDASWRVSVPVGSVVAISFNQFGIDHSSDLPDLCDGSLVIYDGDADDDDEARKLLTACGYVKPDPLTSSTNVVYIQLDHRNARGPSNFSLQWHQLVVMSGELVPAARTKDELLPCTSNRLIVLDDVRATINVSSPGYPYGYAAGVFCSWTFQSAIRTYHPVIRLVVVDLEETAKCLADYVELEGSTDLATWIPLERVCRYEGRHANETTISGTPHLRLNFRTDYYHNRTGFLATVRLQCGGDLTAPEGVIELEHGVRPDLEWCTWNVTVLMGRQIEFEFEQLNASDGALVIIWNGLDNRAPALGVYEGTELPGLQHTTSNGARVHYRRSSARTGSSSNNFRLLYRELSLGCGGTVLLDRHHNTAELRTPNYPAAPPPYLDCVWQILATAGQLLRLDFFDTATFLAPNCDQHYLEVLDGLMESAPVLLRVCHSFTLQHIYTTGNGMRVRYFDERSNGTKPLKVHVSLASCGRSSRSMSGTVTSENYPVPGGYPAHSECKYHINPPTLATPQLTFTDLHLPGNPADGGCADTDSVQLYGVMESSNGSFMLPLGTFCGTTIPPPIESPVVHVVAIFRTLRTARAGYRGFKLTYRTDRYSCSHRIEAPFGEVANPGYDTQMSHRRHCVWRITVPTGQRVKIQFLDLDPTLAHRRERQLLFYDGHSTATDKPREFVRIPYESPSHGLPTPIHSSSNELMIRYFSLREIFGRGTFKVRFSSAEPTLCVGNLNGWEGTIETPSNASTLACTYRRTDRGNGVTLAMNFREVVAGPLGQSCIQIVGAKHLLRKLCSNSKPLILSPFSDTAIELMREATETENGPPPVGFKLDYRVFECGGRYAGSAITNISSSSHNATGHPLHCAWQVLYPKGTLVEITVGRFELRLPCDQEYLTIFNGPLPTSPRIGRFCKDSPIIGSIATHRHELYVEYHVTGGTGVGSFELLLAGKPFGCGGTLHSDTLTFGPPLNGSWYPPNVECVWLLQAQPGRHVSVRFVERFSIEKSPGCTKDFLELFDQRVEGAWISLGRVCGKVVPGVFNSTGPAFRILFRTDNDTESDGFTIRWEVNCGGVFYAEQQPQLILSPNYPEPYSPDQQCSYTILASPNATEHRHIELSFGRFELAEVPSPLPRPSCQSAPASLQLYRRDERSTDPNAWQLAGSYCGRVGPVVPFRALDRARVVFRSSLPGSLEAPGFTFVYRLSACDDNVTSSQRIQSPPSGLPDGASYWSPLHCRWYLAIPPGQKVTVRFEQLVLRHSTDCQDDVVEVYRGLELTAKNRLVKLCGNLTGQAPVVPISGSHGIISYRVGQQTQSSPLVALILYGPDCDRSITLDERSPRYLLSVRGDGVAQDCHYTFQVPTGHTVLIRFGSPFHQLETARNASATEGSCSDALYVDLHDGLSVLSPLIGRYCGTRVAPPAQHSSGPWMHLHYVTYDSDALLLDMRLEATVTMERSLCGPLQHALAPDVEVIVSAPLATDDQPPILQRCLWVFRAPPDHQIELHFLKFDLVSYGELNRCKNYIGIRDATHEPIIYEGLGESLVYHGRSVSSVNFTHDVSYPMAYHKHCGGSNGLPSSYISITNELLATPALAIELATEAVDAVRGWMIAHDLKLATEKTETLVFTSMRNDRVTAYEMDGQALSVSRSIRYLGVMLQERLQWGPHVQFIAEKAMKQVQALRFAMRNHGGPSSQSRKIIASVIDSTLCYAAPIWAEQATNLQCNRRILQRVQREMAKGVASTFRTASYWSAVLLARLVPICLRLNEDARCYRATREHQACALTIRKRERAATFQAWQQEWDKEKDDRTASLHSRWIRRVIPDVERWFSRNHGQRVSSVGSGSMTLSVRLFGSCAQYYTTLQGRILRTVRGQRGSCTITIEVPENHTIAVYFNRFHLEQVECDRGHAVRVYNGTGERPERSLLAEYCGAVTPNPIFSTGRALHFVLPATDAANASLLLDATYVASSNSPGCGGVLYNYGGYLTSPHYPNRVHEPMGCWWHLVVPDNLVVALHFDVFDLGSERTCNTDYLRLLQPTVVDDSTIMTYSIELCASTHMSRFVSRSNVVDLFYRRSAHFDGVGWKLRFMAVEPDENVKFP